MAETNNDVRNTLITYSEKAEIKYQATTTIFYNRINHLDFKYELSIKIPKQVFRKIMFRIFLGTLDNETSVKL